MLKEEVQKTIEQAVRNVYGADSIEIEVTRPEEQFGDFATNAALKLSGKLGKGPREIAETIAAQLRENADFTEVAIAGPGFINIRISDESLKSAIERVGLPQLYEGQNIVAEYSDPNPFKVLHAGHLYTSVVGDSIANLLDAGGASVHKVNFGGDVGLHVGKTMWSILQEIGENAEKLDGVDAGKRSEWMAAHYVNGTNAYEDNPNAKAAIIELNKRVYQLHKDKDNESPFAKIYWTCRQWSYDYFNAFYKMIGSGFEKYYPESEVADLGLQTVRDQQAKGVFEQSNGAVVFNGDKYGLHTRVFINSEGIPTYEAKDVGLIMQKWADYHFDRSVVITGNEQEQYMAVVLKAIEQFEPELVWKTTHLTHGIVKLQGGVKMSSRKGNILRAVDVLDAAAAANKEAVGKNDFNVELGAVKYAFLKQRIGGDIIYDPQESVSLVGNSGPYLQYAHARACAILRKADERDEGRVASDEQLQADERTLVRKLSEWPEVFSAAAMELAPHHIATYLYELAQEFNRFYEKNRVIGDERARLRLWLVGVYTRTLGQGLSLLGITAPESM